MVAKDVKRWNRKPVLKDAKGKSKNRRRKCREPAAWEVRCEEGRILNFEAKNISKKRSPSTFQVQ